jgi:hypothetical protein
MLIITGTAARQFEKDAIPTSVTLSCSHDPTPFFPVWNTDLPLCLFARRR